jgi:hypothetical protein
MCIFNKTYGTLMYIISLKVKKINEVYKLLLLGYIYVQLIKLNATL